MTDLETKQSQCRDFPARAQGKSAQYSTRYKNDLPENFTVLFKNKNNQMSSHYQCKNILESRTTLNDISKFRELDGWDFQWLGVGFIGLCGPQRSSIIPMHMNQWH